MMRVPELRVEYSDRGVTAWGGMKLMRDFMEQTGIKEFLSGLNLPTAGSNRGYASLDIIEAFCVSVWIGARRFVHSGWLQSDSVLREIFGWKATPSHSTYGRFFHKFSWHRNTVVFPALQRWFFQQLRFDRLTLDLDSSVVTRYGTQEGACRGYNSQKPGRPSHHPLMAFMAETRMVVNAWLRPGNTGALSNYQAFLAETFAILQDKVVGLVRADSGFFADHFMGYFEAKKLSYIVAAKFYSSLRLQVLNLQSWVTLHDGIEVAEWSCQLPGWSCPRRMIAIRKNIHRYPKASGKLLTLDLGLEERHYRYSLLVTNLTLPASQVWNLYRDRADAENRIKELKQDFGLNGFCLNKFWATEASLRFVVLAYNLMSLFRQVVLRERDQAMLSTLRFKCFALGAWVVKHAQQRVLKIALARERRAWMDGLFDTIGQVKAPFVWA